MSARPSLTIGVPLYNAARTMRRTLDAALAQTSGDFELLISDNASTDDTEAISREYARVDARVRYVRQPRNLGAIGNFSYVLEHSEGEYFSWLAGDDYYERPSHLESLRARLDAGADLAFPNAKLFKLEPDLSLTPTRVDVLSQFRGASTRFELSRAVMTGASTPVYGMFRREALMRHYFVLVEDAGWSCYNESRFVHRVFSRERCSFVADESLCVSLRPDSVSRSSRPRLLLRDFTRFLRGLPEIYITSDFAPTEKATLLFDVARHHARYLAYLTASALREAGRDAIRSRTRRTGST